MIRQIFYEYAILPEVQFAKKYFLSWVAVVVVVFGVMYLIYLIRRKK